MNREKYIDKRLSRIIEDIYDILFETEFITEGKERFKPIWKNENVEVNYTENKEKSIIIGNKYKLTLTKI